MYYQVEPLEKNPISQIRNCQIVAILYDSNSHLPPSSSIRDFCFGEQFAKYKQKCFPIQSRTPREKGICHIFLVYCPHFQTNCCLIKTFEIRLCDGLFSRTKKIYLQIAEMFPSHPLGTREHNMQKGESDQQTAQGQQTGLGDCRITGCIPGCSLEELILKLKLQYSGHLMQRADSLEKTLTLGKIEGKRRRGQRRMRCLDSITDSMDMSLSKPGEIPKDRGVGQATVHGVTESDTTQDRTTARKASPHPGDQSRVTD